MRPLFQETDGADPQAQAVLAYLNYGRDGIEESWSDEWKRYMAEPRVSRWQNCREQGYVITMNSKNRDRQLNIAFFEHRNSDEICAIKWEQKTMNAPTIETAEFGSHVYKNKHDVSHAVSVGEAMEMADWIFQQLTEFWKATA